MIRAEELMLGDWVFDKDKSIYRQVETEDFYYGRISYFEPIPITPENLEKNGFKQEDDDCYLWNENLERIIWFNDGYTVITSVRCDRVYEGHCYNIHELQHALRLCGITKNIGL